jgi:predicted glycoside hydrolase/deacetylase ChbG (UPF0249 family)
MEKKCLIVNADDYNTDRERNLGIIEGAKNGIVTSTTILTNLPWDDRSLSGLKETFGKNIGVHLNLTKGTPLTQGLTSVTNRQGEFFAKKEIWKKAFLGTLDPVEIEDEFTAQIAYPKKLGVVPTHIDGNNHVHVFPGIIGPAVRAAKRFGITKVRLPAEKFISLKQFFQNGVAKKVLICLLSMNAAEVFRRNGLSFTDHFAGIQYPRLSNTASLRKFVQTLPDGTTELMCHPGYSSSSGNPFSSDDRKQELESLTYPSVLQDMKDESITLISYNDLK